MAEFKFHCPQCGQQIQCDTGYAGMQINCPACQQAIVVPPPGMDAGARQPAAQGAKTGMNLKPAVVTAGVLMLFAIIVGAGWLWFLSQRHGLVAWWPAEGNASEKIGHHNGTMMNGAGYVDGKTGQAFSFNGKDQYVKISPSPGLNPDNQLTIEFWMQAAPDNPMNSFQGLVTSDYYGVEIANGISFYLTSNKGRAWAITSHASIAPGGWHHIAGTYDGARLRLYVDGRLWGTPLAHTGAISPMPSGSFVAIGSEDGRTQFPDCPGSRYFNGLIDEVKIYNRALSDAEIQAIYAKNK